MTTEGKRNQDCVAFDLKHREAWEGFERLLHSHFTSMSPTLITEIEVCELGLTYIG
jgi:hypothetical protein